MKHFIIIFIISIFFIGCNDSGSSDDGQAVGNPSKTFHLKEEGQGQDNYKVTYDLKGSASDGQTFTGLYISENTGIDTLNKVTYKTNRDFLEYINDDSGLTSFSITRYYEDVNSGHMVMAVNEVNGETSVATSPADIPDLAGVGDFGKTTSWKHEDGSTESGVWRLDDINGTVATFELKKSAYNEDGSLYLTATISHEIDETGYRGNINVVLFYPGSGLTVSLSGERVE